MKKVLRKIIGSKEASSKSTSSSSSAVAADNSAVTAPKVASSTNKTVTSTTDKPVNSSRQEQQPTEQEQPTVEEQQSTTEEQQTMSPPKIAIVYYSTYGHIRTLALSIKKGLEAAGATNVALYQIPETLPETVLKLIHAPPKSEDKVLENPEDLLQYDAILFGIPTRYGNNSSQWRAWWDSTGGIWAKGGFYGKYAGVFVSTGTPGGGQEVTALNTISTFTHHGFNFVPLGYKNTFAQLTNLNEVHGGSPWGAGTFAGGDGSRQPSALELEIAELQGKSFYETVSKVNF